MWRNKQALVPYLLLAAALAGGLLWHESDTVPGLGRSIVTGQASSVSQQQYYTKDSTLGSWSGSVCRWWKRSP